VLHFLVRFKNENNDKTSRENGYERAKKSVKNPIEINAIENG